MHAVTRTEEAGLERKWWTLLAVCVATFMLLVDVTIVNVALPAIQRDVHASLTDLQWVVDAYALTLASLLLTAGTLADRIGRRTIFTAGVGIFTAASLGCGLAPDATTLVLARGVQGIGGAAMFATGLALIAQEFPGPERGGAIAAWGATVGLGVAIGPLAGGALTDGIGWAWIFFVNVPVGGFALALAWLRMVEGPRRGEGRIDVAGLATFCGGLFLLVFALLRGNADGWGSALIVSALGAALGLLTLFVIVERRHQRPMFDLALFAKPAFTGVSIATIAIGAGMFAMFLYISLYLQDFLRYSPLQAGLRFLPMSLLVFFVPLATRRFVLRIPPRLVLGGGLLLVSLGLALMHGVRTTSAWTTLLTGLLVCGVGIGFANPAIGSAGLAVVEPARSGMASGINNTCRMGGVATGIAALGALFQHGISTGLSARVTGAPGGLAAATAAGGPPPGHSALANAAQQAFVSGLNDILIAGAAITLVGGVSALVLVRSRDFYRPAAAPGTPTAPVATSETAVAS